MPSGGRRSRPSVHSDRRALGDVRQVPPPGGTEIDGTGRMIRATQRLQVGRTTALLLNYENGRLQSICDGRCKIAVGCRTGHDNQPSLD